MIAKQTIKRVLRKVGFEFLPPLNPHLTQLRSAPGVHEVALPLPL